MTKWERFLAFANFQPVDRVPRHASYVESLLKRMTQFLGENPYAHFDSDVGGAAWLRPPKGYTPPDYSGYYPEYQDGKDGFKLDIYGCGRLNRGFYHFTEVISPLRNTDRIEDIEAYPIPPNTDWLDDELQKACHEAHAAGNFAMLTVGHIYENAWQVRGYEPFLIDLMTRREAAEILLDRFCEIHIRTAAAAGRAGYDCLGSGDDVANQNGMMFAPDVWREVMKPRWAKVYAAARAEKPDIHIWYHSDGNVEDIIEDLIEIGVTILNPVQPECLDAVGIRKRYGKRLAFDGCIGTQTTFPFGTPDDMRRAVRELSAALDGRNGGLMLGPTHVLEPEVPPENVVAFFETCDEL